MEEEILKRLGAFYACQVVREGKYYLLTAHSYQPFSDFPANCIKIDAYYPASNMAYMACRNFAGEIGGRVVNDIPYKEAAFSTGEFLWGRNDLLIHKRFGSYFVLNMIELKEALKLPEVLFKESKKINCSLCGLCAEMCPGKAIDGNGFKRSSCLRDMADRMPEYASFSLLGDSLLGCEVCRSCCPYNAEITSVHPPEELINLMDMRRILIFDKQTREKLAVIIGSNMARASVLLPAAIAGVCRRGAWEHIGLVERLLEHGNGKVREAARLGMRCYEESMGRDSILFE